MSNSPTLNRSMLQPKYAIPSNTLPRQKHRRGSGGVAGARRRVELFVAPSTRSGWLSSISRGVELPYQAVDQRVWPFVTILLIPVPAFDRSAGCECVLFVLTDRHAWNFGHRDQP